MGVAECESLGDGSYPGVDKLYIVLKHRDRNGLGTASVLAARM